MLSQQIDDLEPRLTRHGYSVRTLAEQFNAKPVEIKRLLRGELDAVRARIHQAASRWRGGRPEMASSRA